MRLIFSVIVLLWFYDESFGATVRREISDEGQLQPSNFDSPPYFTQPLYRASILTNLTIIYLDGPIKVSNFADELYVVITSDNYADYSLHIGDSDEENQKQIELELTTTNIMSKEFDVVVLEGLDENLVPVCRTAVLILNSNNNLDVYRMTFKMDGEEYIILNFYYFKLFMVLLIVTGFLILVIELREIVKQVTKRRSEARYRRLHTNGLSLISDDVNPT